MLNIDNKYSYVAKCCEQRANIVNFIEMINAMVRFIWEIDYSLPTNAQMPMNVFYEILSICHMLYNIRRIHGVKSIPKIESFFAKITASELQILVVFPVIGT